MNPFLSILIPNYNGAGLLEENIPFALAAAENTGKSYELVVADDASTDHSCAFIMQHYPAIRLVQGNENLGFAGNCNRGAKQCQGEWILLLNSDVKLHPEYLSCLLMHIGDPGIFGLSGSIWPDGPGEIMDAGKYPQWKGLMLNTTLNFKVADNQKAAYPSLFLSGAASLLHADKFRKLGGFQELFNPYYFEDAEIAIHAWRKGWSSLYIPEAICYHRTSSTIGSHAKKEQVKLVSRRNKLLLHELHLDGFRRLLWKCSLFWYQLLKIVRPDSVNARAFTEYLKRKNQASSARNSVDSSSGIRPLSVVVSEIQNSLQGKVQDLF